jgi:hypothetical protein
MALMNAWKVEHEANLDVVDSQDNMETLVTKWKQIVKLSWSMVISEHHHNCRDKWGPLYGEYKNIHDYISGTCHNEEYWEMFIEEKNMQSLPNTFAKCTLSSLTHSCIIEPTLIHHIHEIS